jgi:hypothetical protein
MTLFMSAQDLGSNGQFTKSFVILDKLEGLLNAPPSVSKPPGAETRPGSNVLYTQARLQWDGMRKNVRAELERTEKRILEHCRAVNDEPNGKYEYDMPEASARVKELYVLLERLDERLIDKLDEALNAAEPALRQARQQEARKIVEEYTGVVSTDPLLAAMTASTLAPSKLKDELLVVLKDLGNKL